jgi:hypothetical protein
MWKWMGAAIVAATVAVSLGCAEPPPNLKPVIEDKIDRDARSGGSDGQDRRPRNEAHATDRGGHADIGRDTLPDRPDAAVQTED